MYRTRRPIPKCKLPPPTFNKIVKSSASAWDMTHDQKKKSFAIAIVWGGVWSNINSNSSESSLAIATVQRVKKVYGRI